MARREEFDEWLSGLKPGLARAFFAAYGRQRGEEALAEALAFAWERFEDLRVMENPAGYLYRVGQSRSRPRRRAPLNFPPPEQLNVPWVEPGLPGALAALSEQQRVCVVLVHGYDWPHQSVADLLGVAPTTVQTHLKRGLAGLRRGLEVTLPNA